MGGAAGRSPQGGAPFLCRPGQALPRAAGRAPPPFSAPGRRRKPGLAAARDQPKENHGRAPDRGPPPPRRPGDGGAPPGGGRIRRRRGTGAGQAANPTPRRPQPAAGPPPPRQSAPGGGGVAPRFSGGQQRDRTQADHGPGAPPPATSQHQRRRGPTGRGRTRPGRCDWGGGGRAGPVPARPAPDRPHTLAGPARHLWGRAGHRHGGGPGRRALQRPRQRAGRGAPGRPHTEQGPSLPVVGRRRRQKNAGKLAPRLDSDWTKKNAGRTLCPPRLPLQRIPDIPLFGVVVRNVLDAGQFHMLL